MIENNRRLREVRQEIRKYQRLLDEADTINQCLIYQGKIESLQREETQIQERYSEE